MGDTDRYIYMEEKNKQGIVRDVVDGGSIF